jgi:hypothetical protein
VLLTTRASAGRREWHVSRAIPGADCDATSPSGCQHSLCGPCVDLHRLTAQPLESPNHPHRRPIQSAIRHQLTLLASISYCISETGGQQAATRCYHDTYWRNGGHSPAQAYGAPDQQLASPRLACPVRSSQSGAVLSRFALFGALGVARGHQDPPVAQSLFHLDPHWIRHAPSTLPCSPLVQNGNPRAPPTGKGVVYDPEALPPLLMLTHAHPPF